MRIPVVIAATAGLLMGACAQDEPKGGAGTAKLEPAFYDNIRQRMPRYFDEINTKVLALCIDWRKSTSRRAAIGYSSMVYTGVGSDGMVSRGELRQSAILNCERYREDNALECGCSVAANGDALVLEPSAEQLALLSTARRAQPSAIRMFAGAGTWEGSAEELEIKVMLITRANKGTMSLTIGAERCKGTYSPARLDASEVTWSVYCPEIGPISGTANTGKEGALSAVGKNVRGQVISFDLRAEL